MPVREENTTLTVTTQVVSVPAREYKAMNKKIWGIVILGALSFFVGSIGIITKWTMMMWAPMTALGLLILTSTLFYSSFLEKKLLRKYGWNGQKPYQIDVDHQIRLGHD